MKYMKYVDTNDFERIFFLFKNLSNEIHMYTSHVFLFNLLVSHPQGKMEVAFLDVNVLSTDVYMYTNSIGSSARRKSGH